jgi:hypothetical protein
MLSNAQIYPCDFHNLPVQQALITVHLATVHLAKLDNLVTRSMVLGGGALASSSDPGP